MNNSDLSRYYLLRFGGVPCDTLPLGEPSPWAKAYQGGEPLRAMLRKHRRKKSHASLSGAFHSLKEEAKKPFDTPLGRDFFYILDFDPTVESFFPEPLTISYEENGVKCTYTPDVLIYFHKWAKPNLRPQLIEIKSKADLKNNGKIYEARFAAAKQLAQLRGWDFLILTEDDIRTPLLVNSRFIGRFRKWEAWQPEFTLLSDEVRNLQLSETWDSTLTQLMAAVANRMRTEKAYQLSVDPDPVAAHGRLVSMGWKLLADGLLIADLKNAVVGFDSPVWHPFKPEK